MWGEVEGIVPQDAVIFGAPRAGESTTSRGEAVRRLQWGAVGRCGRRVGNT